MFSQVANSKMDSRKRSFASTHAIEQDQGNMTISKTVIGQILEAIYDKDKMKKFYDDNKNDKMVCSAVRLKHNIPNEDVIPWQKLRAYTDALYVEKAMTNLK
jgi:hypothetical protein